MTKRHRRKYEKDPFVLARTIALTAPFNEYEQRQLNLPLRLAFDALTKGTATLEDLHSLILTANVTVVRCANSPMEGIATKALDALRRASERYDRLGKVGLDGPGLSEVEQGIELHEELVRLSSPKQMREAALIVDEFRKKHESIRSDTTPA